MNQDLVEAVFHAAPSTDQLELDQSQTVSTSSTGRDKYQWPNNGLRNATDDLEEDDLIYRHKPTTLYEIFMLQQHYEEQLIIQFESTESPTNHRSFVSDHLDSFFATFSFEMQEELMKISAATDLPIVQNFTFWKTLVDIFHAYFSSSNVSRIEKFWNLCQDCHTRVIAHRSDLSSLFNPTVFSNTWTLFSFYQCLIQVAEREYPVKGTLDSMDENRIKSLRVYLSFHLLPFAHRTNGFDASTSCWFFQENEQGYFVLMKYLKPLKRVFHSWVTRKDTDAPVSSWPQDHDDNDDTESSHSSSSPSESDSVHAAGQGRVYQSLSQIIVQQKQATNWSLSVQSR